MENLKFYFITYEVYAPEEKKWCKRTLSPMSNAATATNKATELNKKDTVRDIKVNVFKFEEAIPFGK